MKAFIVVGIVVLMIGTISCVLQTDNTIHIADKRELSDSELIDRASAFGAADTNCAQLVTGAVQCARRFPDLEARVIKVLSQKRTVVFIQNRIPCDGPMTAVTVVLNEDGSLKTITKDVVWPERTKVIPTDELNRQQTPAGDSLKLAPEE